VNGFVFWYRWLFVTAVIISIFGLFMAFFSGTRLFDLFNNQINPVFWEAGALEAGTKAFQQWVYGAWGATVAGWGIFLAFMARYPFRNRELWSWNCLLVGMVVWFVVDTGFSAYFKVYVNVALNAVLFVLVLLPLLFTRRHFAW